ncbi:MAG: hypothetical protein JSW26_12455, partial [Desulfobacterales bacterium]
MKHTRKKNNPMTRNIGILFVFMFAVIAFVLVIAAPSALAHDRHHRHHKDEISFDEAKLFFELNNTDGDLGIHALIDGEAW